MVGQELKRRSWRGDGALWGSWVCEGGAVQRGMEGYTSKLRNFPGSYRWRVKLKLLGEGGVCVCVTCDLRRRKTSQESLGRKIEGFWFLIVAEGKGEGRDREAWTHQDWGEEHCTSAGSPRAADNRP